ncbi:HAD hydrolase-like protein [Hyalangium rubrum]|uniref:HAD hydrolase-like protein n=1 Tax=Hyalangium rubrum TaxID=3103134 RepID=A0ABU5GZ58_9BACT|nr:HAD hydrolase-like protein [Hyalangium sp. s54d21]MDY7226162.1 HAD hydrolase-like protein [Hyalangium sp. s54d21]
MSRASTRHAIFFDLDGTLSDPFEGIASCYRHALTQLSRPVPAATELATFIGPPLRQGFATLLATSDQVLVEQAVTLYRERYATHGAFENRLYDEVPEMLRALNDGTRRLYVATAKARVFAERIIEHFGLSAHFAHVYGPELDGRFENKADLLAHALEREGLDPASCVMIGDRAQDVRAARQNGLVPVGVSYGYGSKEELLEAGAVVICSSPRELASWIRSEGPR